ncbi:MAG TPA: DinB family protein [Terriglobia bacterium]|nr:DinB family protein [Terriglobia bacterium]
MDSLDSFRKLFEYDYWGNQQALQSIEALCGPAEQALKIAGHIIGAQRVWLGRIESPDTFLGAPWPDLTLDEARAAVAVLHHRWSMFLSRVTPEKLDKDRVYRNTKGAELRTPLRDVLMHLVIHSAYHRGQIAAAVRDAGGKPAATDYVVYVRQLKKT